MPTSRELAAIRAALLFWQEEMCPHGAALMRPYLEPAGVEPLAAAEIDSLRRVLRPENVRYALYDAPSGRLVTTRLFTADEAALAAGEESVVVTVVL